MVSTLAIDNNANNSIANLINEVNCDLSNQDKIKSIIIRTIAEIDERCNILLNTILHHPTFQQLEASWLNLFSLVKPATQRKNIKIKLLDLSWLEAKKDLLQALDFDQCELFNILYNQEFGMPGGEPYTAIVGDYQIQLRDEYDDVNALSTLAEILASSFTPFISSISPASLGIDQFTDLDQLPDLEQIFKTAEYYKWEKLRLGENTRFIGLVLPRILVRLPYSSNYAGKMGFVFHEHTTHHEEYLWGNAGYAFAMVLMNSFYESGWFVHLKGSSAHHSGGLIDYLPEIYFSSDHTNIFYNYNVELLLTDAQEKSLADLGFIGLCQIKGSAKAVFYNNNSIHSPKIYSDNIANINARISATLQYLLCACRFAHYIKIIGRTKIGSFLSAPEFESYINSWLIQYVASNEDLTPDQKLNYPLLNAKVQIKQKPGKPGAYSCLIHLQPRVQLEQIRSTLLLMTEISSAK